MSIKKLVKILRRWHVSGDNACLYCPQCWGKYLARFSEDETHLTVRLDSQDGNVSWARKAPFCEMCRRDARE